MPDNAKTLLKSAIVSHERGNPAMAAEISRRILMAYPGTAEARIAVYYLTDLADLSTKQGDDVMT